MINETVDEIQSMQTHSSSVVAVKATRALEELLERDYVTVEEFERSLERNASALRRANPSHASLQNALREVLRVVLDADCDSVESAKDTTKAVIDQVVEDVEQGKHRAAKRAADELTDGATILTHDFSTTVLEAIELALADGKEFEVYVTEARPRYLGRKCVRQLAEMDGIEAHMLVDSAASIFLEECDEVVLGMTCIVGDTFYNRVGTHPIVATAAGMDVPVTVIGSSAKIIDEGFVFENEYRSPSEVMREPAEGFTVENPAYDATPTEYLDTIVTDEDVRSP